MFDSDDIAAIDCFIGKAESSYVITCVHQCWEELQGTTEPSKAVSDPSSATASSALEAELQEMQEQSKPCNSRFFWMKTGINGIVFVKMKHSEGADQTHPQLRALIDWEFVYHVVVF